MCRDVPALSVYARGQERPHQWIETLSLSGELQDVDHLIGTPLYRLHK